MALHDRLTVAAETIAAEIARDRAADQRELAYTRGVWLATRRAWRRRGSDRNIAEFFAAEARYFAVRDAIRARAEAEAQGKSHWGGGFYR
jgi:hypothetical protein